jgi:phosphoenolpyruvate carboxylase
MNDLVEGLPKAVAQTSDVDGRIAHYAARLETHRERLESDPAANPIKLLAGDILGEILVGDVDREDLTRLVRRLTAQAFAARARRIDDYLGETDPAKNRSRLEELITGLLHDEAGALLPLDVARARLARRLYGLVLTAHPTFSLALPLQRDLIRLTIGRFDDGSLLDEAATAELMERVERAYHRPEQRLDLELEHTQSREVIGNLRSALRLLYGIVFDVVSRHYPDDVDSLSPT